MENNYKLLTPTVGGSLSNGWEKMKKNFLTLLLIVLVCAVVQLPVNFFDHRHGEYPFLEFLSFTYWLLFVPIIIYSTDLLFIKVIRSQFIDFKEIIIGFNNYLTIVLAHLLTTALIAISLIALIIPGIIVACRLAFVSYLVMDKGLDPIAAVEESWRMTKGYSWKIFLLGLTSIGIFILGLLCLIVGAIPAIMWICAAFASLYQAILNEQEAKLVILPDAATEENES